MFKNKKLGLWATSICENTNIKKSRDWFRTRFGLQNFAGNYSHNKKFAKSDWQCICKGAREEEGHIVSGDCPVYSDLRSQFGDLGEDKNLVKFFRAVLDRRDTLEEEEDRMCVATFNCHSCC